MNQTQKNIAEYKEKLPHLKEKLVAVALLFVMTMAMLVTSTFAWLSLSLNPQVSDVSTSVASNGNLEIALASGTISESSAPGKSAVGDSRLETLARTLTWGNFINLNDPRYGLKNLVLRPSLLNDTNLIERPLYGPVYDATGRVVDMNTNFGYSSWDTLSSRFVASNNLGVRAITSMTLGESGEQNFYNAELNRVEAANVRFKNKYEALASNQDYMDALASMMTGYMVENILKVNSPDYAGMIKDSKLKLSDLKQFASMYESLIACFEEQAEVYASLLNLQAKILKKDVTITAGDILALTYDKTQKTAYKELVEMGFETYPDSNKTVGIIKDIDNFLYDYRLLKADLVRINGLVDYIGTKTSINWPNCPLVEGTTTRIIDDIINNLTNVGECTITGGDYKNLKIKSVGAGVALKLAGNECETKITNGILYNVDSRSGARIKNLGEPLRLTVNVSIVGEQKIESNVSTSATDNYFENERAFLAKKINEEYGEPTLIANDSYGFAVDFWVRTNAANSYLTLQGNVLTRTDSVDVKGKDLNGEEVQLYTITVRVENTSEGEENTDGETEGGNALEDMMVASYDVYESTYIPEGQQTEVDCWRFADSHQVVTEEALGGQEIPTPLKKVKEVETVIGYEGDNRVWEGEKHSLLTVSSTTQGSGSCYVFYADTPVDQQRSLELLKSMKVAFVDEAGTLLTTAYMDTERHYASAGKVIVPLALDVESISIGTDLNGQEKYAITALEQNVPKRITAIVYLDGTNLTNDKVLSSADIEGQMNIQFGSSVSLIPLNNEKLYNSELYAQVEEIDPVTHNFDEITDGRKMTSKVKIRVTGTQPSTLTANFIRRINDTQGSPEETFILNDADGDGIWEGEYTFLYPGEYILRSVTIDGTDRDLRINEGSSYPTVVVNGFAINSVLYNMEEFIMTDADFYTASVTLKFGTDNPDKMPQTVIGKFMREDGAAVNVNFAYNPTLNSWQGNANFVSSGEYTMQYVVLDGQYVELASGMQKTVDLTLGMKVNVETTSPTTIVCDDEDAPESLKVQVEILNNNNDLIPNLADAWLIYKMTATENIPTKLVYNSGAGYYEGELSVEPGTWKFSHVSIRVGDSPENTLTKVNSDAPVFTIIPSMPPSFVDVVASEAQYIPAGAKPATMSVVIKDYAAEQIFAKLINVDNTEEVKYVGLYDKQEDVGALAYQFAVPAGLWKIEGVSLFNAYDNNSTLHSLPEGMTAENMTEQDYNKGIIFDAQTTEDAFKPQTVAVLHEDMITQINFTNQATGNTLVDPTKGVLTLGKDAEGNLTKTLLAEQKLSSGAIKVRINDTKNLIGRGYFNVDNVTFAYEYGSNVSSDGTTYGGYTDERFVTGVSLAPMSFNKDSGSNTNFTLATNDVNYQYATRYLPNKLAFKVIANLDGAPENPAVEITDQNKLTEDYKAFDLEVWSKRPTIKVTGVNPGVGTTFNVNTGATISSPQGYTQTTGVSNSFSEYEAVVYIKDDGEEWFGATHGYSLPKVKLTLSDMPSSFTNAKAFFPNEAKSDYDKTYTFTPSALTQENSIGGVGSDWGNVPIYAAGKQTVNKITVQVNSNVSFEVELSHPVTIMQSYSHQAVTFKINDASYTGEQPSKIQLNAPLGKHSITLPSQEYKWSTTSEKTTNGEFIQQGNPTTRAVYTERSETTGSGCNEKTTHYYTPYTETTTIYKAQSSLTTTTTNKRVTGWKVNGVTYAPGATVEVTGPTTITAVVESTSTSVTEDSITTRTVISYGNQGAETTSKPSGSKVTSVTGSTTDSTEKVN